ncbi:MAG: class I SAM-dependent methyltransferase [bacterium]
MTKWEKEEGIIFLKKVGVRQGQAVLDFGCGSGNYTIIAAKIVGDEGKIYALDKNSEKLDKLKERLQKEGLYNVTIVKKSEDVNISLKENSIDSVLLYDVIHLVGKKNSSKKADREKLYNEIYRIAKEDGLISVYPTHLETHTDVGNIEEIKKEILNYGFKLEKEFSEKLIHDDNKEIGTIINFRKLK